MAHLSLAEKDVLVNREELETVNHPEIRLNNYNIRLMSETDFEEVAQFQDNSLAEKLTVEKLEKRTQKRCVFLPGERTMVGFVAENILNGEIVGRNYIETWHGKDLTTPKYQLTETGGIKVIGAQDLFKCATNVVELGGWLVKSDYQGEGIGKALTYSNLLFIDQLRRKGHNIDLAFVTYVGQFRQQDNDKKIDFSKRIFRLLSQKVGTPINEDNLEMLVGEGELITTDEIKEVFAELDSDYFIGKPRKSTLPAYGIANRLINDQPLICSEGKNLKSPLAFTCVRSIHPIYGGKYTVAYLK